MVCQVDNEAEVLATYGQYIEYFLANDVDGISSLVDYSITYISDGHCVSLDSYPVMPDDMRKKKGWDTSIDVSTTVQGVNKTKAHVITTATRIRKDKSVIGNVAAFYALLKKGDDWKMYAISDVVFEDH